MKTKKKKQLRYLKWFMLIFCLTGSVYLVHSSLVSPNPLVKAAKKTTLESGEVQLSKVAEPVTGMVNQWDITLRIEGHQLPPPPTDIVLVIDTSYSMEEKKRMVKAKSAAEKFVNMVLQKGYVNRIALITYNSKVTTYTFNESGWSGQFVDSAHKGLLITKIKELKPVEGSGTFTQAGIKSATERLKQATAKKRNIVLISDGVPTYSYPTIAPYNQFVSMTKYERTPPNGYDYYETVKTIPKEKFDYSYSNLYGPGDKYRYGGHPPEYEKMPEGSKDRLMVNHAHSAIAEATITKNEKMSTGELLVTDFYTIGVDLDASSLDDEIITGNQTLKEIASSEDKVFSATADNLDAILSGIAGEMNAAVKSAVVVDPMGQGFEIDGGVTATQGTTEIKNGSNARPTINWDIGEALQTPVSKDPKEDVMFAEIRYRVTANNEILKPKIIDTNGLAATNGRTSIGYKDKDDVVNQSDFIVPKVKPIIVSLQKKLHTATGTEVGDQTELFDFKYGNDQYTMNDTFSLYPNEVKKIVHPWKANQTYFVEEVLKGHQDYRTVVAINGQTTTGKKSSFKFVGDADTYRHQQIIVTNKEKPENQTIVLNIRQSVINPTSELVIPSKGYYQLVIDDTQQTLNLISESSIKDQSTEVSEELFAKYEITLEQQLKITNLIPEYYTFLGYIATTSNKELNETHLSSNTTALIMNNEAVLDYLSENEYWITLFITPKLGKDTSGELEQSPRPYSWDYKVNKFGYQ